MKVTINGSAIIDDQEKLFQEVMESFKLFMAEYQSHWFRNFFHSAYCDLTEGYKAKKDYHAWLKGNDDEEEEC